MKSCNNCEFCSDESEDQCTLHPGFGDAEACKHYTDKSSRDMTKKDLEMLKLELAFILLANGSCENCPAKAGDCRKTTPAKCADNWSDYLEKRFNELNQKELIDG